jgi:sulfur relay protein TusC/DsrF
MLGECPEVSIRPMKYAIQINDSPTRSGSARTGFQFIKAALASGHEVVRVFFYQEGIYNAFIPGDSAEAAVPDWTAFDQAITVLFVDDGVYRLTRETGEPVPTMEPAGLLELLAFYDIESIWVEEESLVQRDMNLDEARLSVRTILREDVAGLLARHDAILGD